MLLQIYLVKGGWAICEQVAHLVHDFHASSFDAKHTDKTSRVNDMGTKLIFEIEMEERILIRGLLAAVRQQLQTAYHMN